MGSNDAGSRPNGPVARGFHDGQEATDHPDYHLIKVVMTDGTEYTTRSTWGKEGDSLHLDIDPNTHPAWTGGQQQLLDRGGRVSRFNSRFGGMAFGQEVSEASRRVKRPRRRPGFFVRADDGRRSR